MKKRYFFAAVLVMGVSGAGLAADHRPRPRRTLMAAGPPPS